MTIMTTNHFRAAALAALATFAASSALAQAPAAKPAAPAAPPLSHGAPIAGVCIFSAERAVGTSTVGQYVSTRLQQLIAQVNAELNAEKTALDNEAKTLEGQRNTLDQNSWEQKAAALQVRANAIQRKAQQREREIQATEQKALGRVYQEMEPLIRQTYQSKSCAVLLNQQAVILGNPAMDVTPQVISALNAKITQFAFDRERLDQTPAAPAPTQTPGAARPK